MAMCTVCKSEIPVYERRCQSCGAGVVRDANSLLADAPTDKELSRARLVHLLALPGMLIMGLLIETAVDRVGLLAFVPLNLLVPFVFWLSLLKSRFVRSHGLAVFNSSQPKHDASSSCGQWQCTSSGSGSTCWLSD